MQATWNKKDKLYEDEQKEETAPSICQQPTIRKKRNELVISHKHKVGTPFPSFCNQTASGDRFHHTILSATLRISILQFLCWSLWMWRTVQGQCLPVVHAQPPCQVLEAAGWREAMIAMPSMGRKSAGCLWWLRAVRLCFIHLYPSLSIFILYISFHPVCLVTFEGSVGEPSIRETLGHTFLPWRSLEPWSFFFLMYFWGKLWQMDFGLMNSSMFWRKPTYVYIYIYIYI